MRIRVLHPSPEPSSIRLKVSPVMSWAILFLWLRIISNSHAAGRYPASSVIFLKIALPALSKISQDGKRLFLRERPSLIALANCSSEENDFGPDFSIFVSNKTVTPLSAGWIDLVDSVCYSTYLNSFLHLYLLSLTITAGQSFPQ